MPVLPSVLRPHSAAASALAAVAVLFAAALAGLSAPAARAGTYTVDACQTAAGAPASTTGWSWSSYTKTTDSYVNGCPGSGMTLVMKPGVTHARDDYERLTFTAPAGTTIAGYDVWRSVRVAVAQRYFYSSTETAPGAAETWPTPCGGFSNSCGAFGNPLAPADPSNHVARTPPTPLKSIGMYVSCGRYASDDGDCASATPIAASATIWRAEIVLADGTAPTIVTPPVGGLLGAGVLSGVQDVSVLATDVGGGVASASVEVDGQVLASAPIGSAATTCQVPYTTPVPCPLSASGTIALDTSRLADGAHSVRVLVTDAAGNTTAWGPVAITTSNAQQLCSPSPRAPKASGTMSTWIAAAPLPPKQHRASKKKRASKKHRARASAAGEHHRSVTVGLGRAHAAAASKHHRSVTVGLGQASVLSGRLTANGAPVAGATVCISTRADGSAGFVPIAHVTTDSDGGFSADVPHGVSREVWAVYRVGGAAVSATALARTRPSLTLRPARHRLRAGALLVMHGRLTGAPLPHGGVLLNLQAKRGRTWQTFRQVRVRGAGPFRIRYRFVGGAGVHRYALRATLPAQGSYPYAAAASRAFTVSVSG